MARVFCIKNVTRVESPSFFNVTRVESLTESPYHCILPGVDKRGANKTVTSRPSFLIDAVVSPFLSVSRLVFAYYFLKNFQTTLKPHLISSEASRTFFKIK